jgi:hypothetical protein
MVRPETSDGRMRSQRVPRRWRTVRVKTPWSSAARCRVHDPETTGAPRGAGPSCVVRRARPVPHSSLVPRSERAGNWLAV